MDESHPHFDDEIDLVEVLQTIWDGKWKVVGTVVISVLSVFGYQWTQPEPNFEARTEITSISSEEALQYQLSNAVGFFEVTPSTLIDLYIEQLEERIFFNAAVRNYELLDTEDFEDEKAFDEAVTELVASIEILPLMDGDEIDLRGYWSVEGEYNDRDKWKRVLSSVDAFANQAVKKILQQQFQTSLSIARQKREFALQDLELQISNALADYDKATSYRLAYLREQAAIARTLGVAKNTIEAQTFGAQNGVFANVTTDTPFYLRGYEAIEKEMELIESRSSKEAFTVGFLELEQKLRALQQDRTLERAEASFVLTPIMTADDFSAVSVMVEATNFESQSKRRVMVAVAAAIGGMLGVLYVLIASAIRARKQA